MLCCCVQHRHVYVWLIMRETKQSKEHSQPWHKRSARTNGRPQAHAPHAALQVVPEHHYLLQHSCDLDLIKHVYEPASQQCPS